MTNENALHGNLIDEPIVRQGGNSGVAAGQLRNFVERIERLEEEKGTIAQDIKEVSRRAKRAGWTPGSCAGSSRCGRRMPPNGKRKKRSSPST
jgi:hypothetical protein